MAQADEYYLVVYDNSTDARIDRLYTAAEAGCDESTGFCSIWSDTCLSAGTGTSWIQARSSSGYYGPWSNERVFTVSPVLGKPLLTSPSGTIYDATPTYSWEAVADATWYRLSVYDGTSPNFTKWYSAADAGCSTGAGSCSVSPDIALAKGDHEWWVQAWKEDNIYGPWSDGIMFTVPVPVLVSPAGGISTNIPTYTWTADPNSTWYYLWVDDSTGNRIKQWYTAAQAGCSGGAGTCAVYLDIALARGSAKWWIQTWSPVGYRPWSDAKSFMVPAPVLPGQVELVSPSPQTQ